MTLPTPTPPRDVTFFGYWTGKVPPVTDLHFRSFLHHHPGARYELWLDEDDASSIEAPSLKWLESHPRIVVRRFSLNALIEKHVSDKPVAAYERFGALRRFARALHRKAAPSWARRKAVDHPIFGLTYKHSSSLFLGFNSNKAYRGDLARALIPLEHYDGACLYVDLDTCFLSDLRELCADTAWTYRWEKFEFANSAILYLPDARWSAALTAKGCALENFLPWVLFTDPVCKELGIQVHPTRLFDPLWDPASLLYGEPQRFFCARDQLALDLHALTLERHLAIHWHNNWKTTPAATSIYAGLMKACEAPAPADARAGGRPAAITPESTGSAS
jgi:hypothetical protein